MKSMRLVLPSVVLALFIAVKVPCQTDLNQDFEIPSPTFGDAPELIDNQSAQELKVKTDSALRRLQSDAVFAIDDYRIQAEKNEISLKEHAEDQAKKIQARAARDAERVLKQAQEQVKRLKDDTEKKVILADQKRAEDMLTVVFNAEQEALKIKFQERKKGLWKEDRGLPAYQSPNFMGSRVPVTQEWRDTMFKSFDHDSLFIKNIIVEGESPDEARDFVGKFNEQAMWFDSTLRGTQYFHDVFYEQIMRKKSIINKLAVTQGKADEILQRFGKKIALSDSEQQKLRLFVLYDLNGFINKSATENTEGDQILPLDDKAVQNIVVRVADEVLGAKLKKRGLVAELVMKEVEPVDRQVFDTLKKEMDEIKGVLDEEIIKYSTLKEQRKNIDQSKTKEALDIELQLKESQVLINHYKDQLKRAQHEQINATIKCNDLVRQIEARAKESLNFELKLNDAQRQLAENKNRLTADGALRERFKPELEAGERRALEIETDLKSSEQTIKHLKDELATTINEVAAQKDAIITQNKMYRELSTRGEVLEELAEQRFNEHEQKMTAGSIVNDNMK
ncbi:MAG: hypothetical protein WCT20_00855 [Candidatus Babeliales bacterium]